jgi:rhodanese-related sulfurtransferase
MVAKMTVTELAEKLRGSAPGLVLLDVREDEERATAKIEPSVHIPMQQVPGRTQELPKDRTVVVYCHHGGRSEMVAGFLAGQGFDRVVNLEGGIDAWSRKVDPSVPRY